MSDLLDRVRESLAHLFEVEEEIGRGGMARVFRARDRKHDRRVALKVLEPRVAATLGADRFLREIRIAARLQHPNIVPLFDSGADGELLWYTMPLVDGETLRHRIDADGPLPVDDAIRIAREVAAALDYAHRNGVVHRDIKPGNVMLSGNVAVVTDFGIARAVDEAADDRLTATGLAIGSVSYMSPEQWEGRRELDGRSDVYALGCVLYEMLTGTAPFRAGTSSAFMAKHLSEPPPALEGTRGAVPYPAERALFRALEKDPGRRYESAAEFGDALLRAPGWRGLVTDVATDLWRRRVPHFLGAYMVATWAAVLLVRTLADRLMLSSDLPALVLAGMIALLPSVLILGYFHGGTGRAWAPAERAGLALNAVGAAALLYLLFQGRDLGRIAEPEPFVDSEGTERVEWVPAEGEVRRVGVFYFENRSGDPDLDWVSYAIPLALDADLEQDLAVLARTGLVEELRERGEERWTSVPPALRREVARQAELDWVYGGWFEGRPDSLAVHTTLTALDRARTGGSEAASHEWRTSADDLMSVADTLAEVLKADLGLPSGYLERVEDRPATEILTGSPRALRRYVEGIRLRTISGDPGAAVGALREAVEFDPDFALAWNELSLAAFSAGDEDLALDAKRRVIGLDYRLPRWKYLSLLQGYYTMGGQTEAAMAVAEERVARYPDDLEARRSLARVYANAGRVAEAIAQWEILYEREPGHAEYLLAIARALAGTSDRARARLAFDRYLGTGEASLEGRDAFARFLRAGGELDRAGDVYRDALLLDPSDVAMRVGFAEVEAGRGDFDGAERELQRALEAATSAEQRATVLETVADLNLTLGRLDAARRAEERTREERPRFLDLPSAAIGNLEGMQWVAGSLGEREALRQVDSIASGLPAVLRPLAALGRWATFQALEEGDSLLAALEDAEAALSVFGLEPAIRAELLLARADARRWTGEACPAVPLYRGALAAGLRDSARAGWTGLSGAELACGNADNALAAADSALTLAPGDPAAALARARALAAMRRPREARRALEPALAAWSGADPGFRPAARARELARELDGSAP